MTSVADTPFSSSSVASPDTLAELEFGRALDRVAARAVSTLGAEAVRSRRPLSDPAAITHELARVSELARHLDEAGQFRPAAVVDLTAELDTLRLEGAVLEADGLLRVADAIRAIRENGALLEQHEASLPLTFDLAVAMPPAGVADAIARAIDADGTVRDGASTAVTSARRRVRDTRRRLVAMLERVARGVSGDPHVTIREGRYVVSVPRDARGSVRGLVHAQSASGASLFVEPEDAVEMGNDLRMAEADEVRAVNQVFRDLSEQVRAVLVELEAGWSMSVALDDLYARAQYALDVEASIPTAAEWSEAFAINDGYHPLLREEKGAVPFSVRLVPGGTLLVSGPNAGGKTVLLKAVGLLAAMTQSGVVPPMGKGSVTPAFRQIRVDIGDHQSIAASLSTFSAHLESLKHILGKSEPGSLVLLDEIGGGTDPIEGGALAGAVLEGLQSRGATTVATTHLSDLKEAATASEHMTNASLEFNTETLAPTYRLRVGKPGRSYGLAIAKRLGLPVDVVTAAESRIPEAIMTLDATLAELERREIALHEQEVANEDLRLRLEAEQIRVGELRERLTHFERDVQERERQLEKAGRERARTFLLESRRRVEEALALARAAVDEATAKQARRLVEEGVQEEADAIQKLAALEEKGWRVGKGRRATGGGRRDEHQGSSSGDSEIGQQPPAHGKQRTSHGFSGSDVEAATEINVRGMRADEAAAAVVAAIDAAVVADLPRLRIIHGKGTGALRSVVNEIVRDDARVARGSMAPPEQGGAGVTIVEFR